MKYRFPPYRMRRRGFLAGTLAVFAGISVGTFLHFRPANARVISAGGSACVGRHAELSLALREKIARHDRSSQAAQSAAARALKICGCPQCGTRIGPASV